MASLSLPDRKTHKSPVWRLDEEAQLASWHGTEPSPRTVTLWRERLFELCDFRVGVSIIRIRGTEKIRQKPDDLYEADVLDCNHWDMHNNSALVDEGGLLGNGPGNQTKLIECSASSLYPKDDCQRTPDRFFGRMNK